jgi:hypothetical protein
MIYEQPLLENMLSHSGPCYLPHNVEICDLPPIFFKLFEFNSEIPKSMNGKGITLLLNFCNTYDNQIYNMVNAYFPEFNIAKYANIEESSNLKLNVAFLHNTKNISIVFSSLIWIEKSTMYIPFEINDLSKGIDNRKTFLMKL